MVTAITESRRRLATSAKPEAVNLPVAFPIGAVSSGPGSLDEERRDRVVCPDRVVCRWNDDDYPRFALGQ